MFVLILKIFYNIFSLKEHLGSRHTVIQNSPQYNKTQKRKAYKKVTSLYQKLLSVVSM